MNKSDLLHTKAKQMILLNIGSQSECTLSLLERNELSPSAVIRQAPARSPRPWRAQGQHRLTVDCVPVNTARATARTGPASFRTQDSVLPVLILACVGVHVWETKTNDLLYI